MGVETATYISQLSATNPLGTDPISEGDNQIRLVKDVLQKQFTTLGAAAVTTTAGELNILDGVTSTAAELNILDGVTSTTAELNILDGVTSTAAELNILDGVTSTAAELNILDGVTATAGELNYNDITTLGTVQTSKALTATAAGLVNHVDYVVQRPEIKDYSETKSAGTPAATVDLDMEDGNVFTISPDQNTTFTFSNPSPTGKSCAFTLVWTQDGSDRTATWPASVDWAAATAPTLTSGSGKIDVFTFFTMDAGTIWYGFVAGQDMATPS